MREGWIDWALLDLQPTEKPVEEAVGGGVYAEGQEGGRVKPDGDELRWKVTFPNVEHGRGGVPFFCKDLTPRKRRVRYPFVWASFGPRMELIHQNNKVPTDVPANLKHACGATRVAAIRLVAKQDAIDRLAGQFDLVLGTQGRRDSVSPLTYTWEVEVPVPVLQKSEPTSIMLKAATSPEETEWAQGLGMVAAGIWQVELIANRQAQIAGSLSLEEETSPVQIIKLGFMEKVQA